MGNSNRKLPHFNSISKDKKPPVHNRTESKSKDHAEKQKNIDENKNTFIAKDELKLDALTVDNLEKKRSGFVEEFTYFNNLSFSRSPSPYASRSVTDVSHTKSPDSKNPTLTIVENRMFITPNASKMDISENSQDIIAKQDTGQMFDEKPLAQESMDGSLSACFFGDTTKMTNSMFMKFKSENGEDPKCSVCLQSFEPNTQIGRLMCNHMFHRSCIYHWLKTNSKCPLCREDVQKFSNVPFL
eukprot:59735_1